MFVVDLATRESRAISQSRMPSATVGRRNTAPSAEPELAASSAAGAVAPMSKGDIQWENMTTPTVGTLNGAERDPSNTQPSWLCTKHQRQVSPGSNERITGCFVLS